MDLMEKENLELPYNELLQFCLSTNIEVTKEQIDQVQKKNTISPSSGTSVFKHRTGRIGVVQCKASALSDPASNTANL